MAISKAFSLIELMIVIAIVGILATIGVPSYQGYLMRSKISEAVAIAGSINNKAAEYYTTNGSWPTSLSAMNLTASAFNTTYISGLTFATTANAPIFGLVLNVATVGESGVSVGTAGTLYFGSKQSAGSEVIKTNCGQYTAAKAGSVHIKYLPIGCKDTDVFTFLDTP